jgi:cytidine deaminase
MDAGAAERLLQAARVASTRARPKHSGFRVGAAVLDADGRLHAGCNVESDSYGLTVCAERVAIYAALAAGAGPLVALAVSCPDAPPGPPAGRMPCGACRQVMAEYLPTNALVLVDGVGTLQVSELLPQPFRLSPLADESEPAEPERLATGPEDLSDTP